MRALIVGLICLAAGSASARSGDRCLLVVDGKTYLDGPCPVDVKPGGNYMIGNTKKITYFATVQSKGVGAAAGFWNEQRGAGDARTPLGDLRQNGPCWTNDRAVICAWWR
ncbi:hypothetical protein [Terrarubrum flagellatum]|uniref:hypothetical protein n=1 Tax=Terrirubrum flagellatum TaxID=2895980 RepID=UPI003144F158